jgi:hypothetical protein
MTPGSSRIDVAPVAQSQAAVVPELILGHVRVRSPFSDTACSLSSAPPTSIGGAGARPDHCRQPVPEVTRGYSHCASLSRYDTLS